MKKEILKQIVRHFLDLYKEEIENDQITGEVICEWWGYTRDQYGYNAEEGSDVYPEVEKAIWTAIKDEDE